MVSRIKNLRIQFILVLSLIGFMLLATRAVFIHLFPNASKNLHSIADNQYYKPLDLSPYRGSIYDRRGEALAISLRLPTLCVNPRVFAPNKKEKRQLAKILGLPVKKISKIAAKKNYFAYLKRKTTPAAAKAALDLAVKGLYKVMEPARSYPNGTLAAPLLGFVGIEDNGLAGIERQYNKDLKGEMIQIKPSKDARGHTIYLNMAGIDPQQTGNNIHLTIDSAIQQIAETALEKGVEHAKAKHGFALVSDPHTGRILAVANYPTFNPNKIKKLKMSNTKNRAFMDVYEPGSVVKPLLIARALERGVTKLDTLHNCENGKIKVGKHTIHDVKKNKILSTEQVLVKSSNVCTYKIASKLGPEQLHKNYKTFGIAASRYLTGFPGEGSGRLGNWKRWREIRFANIAFGQGLLTTGLELIQAYGAIANGGKLFQPQIVDRIESSDGLLLKSFSPKENGHALSPEVARKIRTALQKVVDKGTYNAQSKKYSTAGKTGTAEKVDPKLKRYSDHLRIASFAGFAPVEDPYVVVYVYIDEPGKKPYYGSLWAAPVFREITEKTLNYLNVKPTKIGTKVSVSKKPKPKL